jgi:hypothetical protein
VGLGPAWTAAPWQDPLYSGLMMQGMVGEGGATAASPARGGAAVSGARRRGR